MLKLIIFKELREIILSTKFAATFGVCSLLIIMAFYTGIKNYQSSVQEYNASKAALFSQFETAKDWREVPRLTVFLPPNPLASLVMGISNDIGRAAVIYDSGYQAFRDSVYSVNPVFAVFRFLDLEFIFLIVLSLFAILFAFDAINGEKERGTLRLSFANSMPRATYIFGKITGSFLALALPLLIPVMTGLLLLPLMEVPLSVNEWIRLLIFIICGLLYLGVFLTLSVFISSITKRSSSSFLFLLIIWVCSVLIIPRAAVLLSGNLITVPSTSKIYYQRVQMQMNNIQELLKRANEQINKIAQEMAASGDTSPEAQKRYTDKMSEVYKNLQEENDKKISAYISRLHEERYNKQKQQERLALGISRISPATVFTLAATGLCGTSLELRNNYEEKVLTYSGIYSDFISGKQSQPAQDNIVKETVNPREIPDFYYQPKGFSDILKDALPDITILLVFNIILFCGAFIAFLRYDLR
ncbi:MAG: ABC transporter permease subunit [Deltaproteobacteria bacterium]|nr:ABC transporter permease subunit [Deltaproteobacteria bacterium]